MSARAGYTLLEMMVAVAILSIGAGTLVGAFKAYERAAHRARAVVAIAELLDQEMEAARACPTRACLRALAASAVEPARPEAASWLRPRIGRRMASGPDRTIEWTVSAHVPGLVPERTLVAHLEAPP